MLWTKQFAFFNEQEFVRHNKNRTGIESSVWNQDDEFSLEPVQLGL